MSEPVGSDDVGSRPVRLQQPAPPPATLVELTQTGAMGGPDTSGPVAAPPLAWQLAPAVGLGLVAGPVLGGAQAMVLRTHVPRAWRWLPANAAAWAIGMPSVFVVAGGMPPDWPPIVVAVGVLASLGLVGGVVGAVRIRLVAAVRDPDAPPPSRAPRRDHRRHGPPRPRQPIRRELP